jgi:hypothetical protein
MSDGGPPPQWFRASLVLVLLLAAVDGGLWAQEGRARIALFGLEAGSAASSIKPVTDAVADTMALTLALLGRFEVIRLEEPDALADLAALREYCETNHIDQAIGGSGTARAGGGYHFRLGVYDRHKDRVSLVREGASSGLLDVFEVTDELVAGLLESLSGTHIGFGSLELELRGEERGEYEVLIDGTSAGEGISSVGKLLIGRRTVRVRQRRLLREVDIASAVVQVPEDGRVVVPFEIPAVMEEEQRELDRLMGIARAGWNERSRAGEVEAALERGVRLLEAAHCSERLAGMAEGWWAQSVLHGLVKCEWRVQEGLPGVDVEALEDDVQRFSITVKLAEEGPDREAALGILRRVFALVRLAAINDFAANRWEPGMAKQELLWGLASTTPPAADEGFLGEAWLVRSRYEEKQAGKAGAASRLREDLGKEWQAAQELFKDFATLKGSELVVVSDPPGRTVTVNGKRQGETPLRVRGLAAGAASVTVSDLWYATAERQVTLANGRTYLFLEASAPLRPELKPELKPAECFGDSVGFSWSKVPDARTYTLQLLGNTGWSKRAIEQVTGIRSTTYTLKRTLEPGMRYWYRVRPVSGDGSPGPWSAGAPLEGQLVWTQASVVPQFLALDTSSARSIVFHDRMWVLGGHTSTTIAAFDGGTSWIRESSSAPFGRRGDFGLVEFEGRLWLIGGDRIVDTRDPAVRDYFNDIWSSTDGKEWRLEVAEAPFSPRARFTCLVLNGRLWVIGGRRATGEPLDIWSSEDGIAWRREGAPREIINHQPGVLFQNAMWHVSGYSGVPRVVVSSTDGIHWTTAGPAPMSTMTEELHTVYQDQMWLIGGRYPGEVFKFRVSDEVWYSIDGRTCKKSIPATPSWFPARHDAQGYEYQGRLWVMFGNNNVTRLDGMWCAEPAPWP